MYRSFLGIGGVLDIFLCLGGHFIHFLVIFLKHVK